MFTLGDAIITSPQLPAVGTTTIKNLVVRQDGFDLGSFVLSVGSSSSSTIKASGAKASSPVSFDGVKLQVDDFKYRNGTNSYFDGNILITADSIALFPNSSLINTTFSGLSFEFDLGGQGEMSILLQKLTLRVGSAIEINANNVKVYPDRDEVAIIANAEIQSPQFTALNKATISNLIIRKDGFSLGNVTLSGTAGTKVKLGSALEFSDLKIEVKDFSYNTNGSVSGVITITTGSLSLYPGSTLIKTTVSGFRATYDFDNKGALLISVAELKLGIGNSFELTAQQVVLTPQESLIASISSAQVRLPNLNGLDAITLQNIKLYDDHFELGSAVVQQAAGTSATFGNFLQISGVKLELKNFSVSFSGSTKVSGSLEFSAEKASLYPNATFLTSTLSGLTSQFDWTSGNLTLQVSSFSLFVGDALQLTALNVSITPNEDVLATIGDASIQSPLFKSLGAVTLKNFVLRKDGFRFDSLNWTTPADQTTSFGEIIQIKGVTLNVQNFAVNYGSTTTVSGKLDFTINGLSLFPNSSVVQTNAQGITLNFDFENTGALKIKLESLKIAFGEALEINASNISLTPAADEIAVIEGATVTSKTITNLDEGKIEKLVIKKDGFQLGSLSISQKANTVSNIGSVLKVEGAKLVVTDFGLSIGNSTTITGKISLIADSVSLYPNLKSVITTVDGFSAEYAFDSGNGKLKIQIGKLVFAIGSAIRLEAEKVDIEPSNPTAIATIKSATISSPQLRNIKPIQITGLILRQDGFSLDALKLEQVADTSVFIGNFLRMDGVSVEVKNLNVYSNGTVTGAITISITKLDIYPNSTLLKSEMSEITASYDFTTGKGELSISLGKFRLDIGDAVSLQATNVQITPDKDEIAKIATLSLTSPKMEGLAPVQVTDFILRKDGFQFAALELRLPAGKQTAVIGSILEVSNPRLTLSNFSISYGSSVSVSGTIQFGVDSIKLFPNATFIKSDLKNFQGSLDLTDGTGSLRIQVGEFNLSVGDALSLSAANVVLTPSSDQVAKIASVTVTAGGIKGLAPVTIQNLIIYKDGISFGSFTLRQATGSTVSAGSAISLSGVAITVNNFSFRSNSDGITTAGSITVSVTNISLFPGGQYVSTEVNGVTGTYDFSNKGKLKFTVGSLKLNIGKGAVVIDASNIALDPFAEGTNPIASIQEASISTPRFPSLPTAKILMLEIRQDGFRIGSFVLSQNATTTIKIGSILQFSGLSLTIDNFSYKYGQSPSIEGTISVGATSAVLFPGNTSFTSSITGIVGTFNLTTGAFQLTADKLLFAFGTTLEITGSKLVIDPDSDIIASMNEVTATLPSFKLSGKATGLEISKDGKFSVVSIEVNTAGIMGRFGLGKFLPFDISSVSVHFLGDANNNGLRDSGEVFDLTEFDLTVRGSFNMDMMKSKLPFTPILTIGNGASSRTATSGADTFEFTITVIDGELAPKDFGPITIGFADLKIGQTAVLGGTITLGGYQNGVWVNQFGGSINLKQSDTMSSIQSAGVALMGAYDDAQGILTANGNLTASFKIGSAVNVTNAKLSFSLVVSYSDANGYSLDLLRLDGLDVEKIQLQLGSVMTLEGTGVALNFNPGPDEYIATFGSLSANLTQLGVGGTARNFGIKPDGSVTTLTGFSVSLNISDPSKLKWPSWLPINITEVGLYWPDFDKDISNFQIILSASVTSIKGISMLKVEGSVTGVVIDIGLLKEGKFPIVDIAGAGVKVSGNAFGGTIDGAVFLEVLKLDDKGNIIPNTDRSTPVADRVFYGGISAGFNFAGLSGFKIQIGLSELGPLQIYMSASIPVLIEPISGLSLTNFRAGITFNTTLPSITDPFELRGSAFKPAAQLSFDEWRNTLREAVKAQIKAGMTSGDFWSVFTKPMKIEGGATLYSIYTPIQTFSADVDILLSTDGKFLINARMVFGRGTGGEVSLNAKLYADLSDTSKAVTILFLVDQPAESPIITYFGGIQFIFSRTDGTPVSETNTADKFQIKISGGVKLSALSFLSVTIEGQIILTFTSGRIDAEINGKVNLGMLGDRLGVAGTLHLDMRGSTPKVWGALAILPNFTELEKIGLYVDGTVVWRLNFTNDTYVEKLNIPGRGEVQVQLNPMSVSLLIEGYLIFRMGGQDWFRIQGVFGWEFSAAGYDVFLKGILIIGDPNSSILKFSLEGYLKLYIDGFAAKLDIELNTNFPEAFMTEISGKFLLLLNTTKRDIEYVLPDSIIKPPGDQLDRTIRIPGAPVGSTEKQPYMYIDAVGNLKLVTLQMDGTFKLLVSPSVLQVELNTSMKLSAGNVDIFTFNFAGGLRVDKFGIAAVIDLGRNFKLPDTLGFTFDAGITARLEVNTTGNAVTLAGITLEAGRYAMVRITGKLNIANVFVLDGYFLVSAGTNGVVLDARASLDIKIGDTKLWSFLVQGGFIINQYGIAGAFAISQSAALPISIGMSYELSFQIEVNTTGREQVIGGIILSKDVLARISASGSITIIGLQIKGEFKITLATTYVQLDAIGKLIVGIEGFTLFDLKVNGGFRISTKGIAAALSLQLNVGVPASFGFSLDATFDLRVNTTNEALTLGGIALDAGKYARLILNGTLKVAGFEFIGKFTISVGTTEVRIEGSVTMRLKVGDLVILSFNAEAGFLVNSRGIAARFNVSLNQNLPGNFGSFGGSFTVEINLTGESVTLNDKVLAAGYYGRLLVDGYIQVAGFKFTGSLVICVSDEGFMASGKVGFTVFSYEFNVTAEFAMMKDGIAARIVLPIPEVDMVLFKLKGSFGFELNTTSRRIFEIAPGSAAIYVREAKIELLGLKMTGTVIISVSNGLFQILVPADDPLTLDFFGIANIQVYGYIRSDGKFSLTGTATVNIGREDIIFISGKMSVTLADTGISASLYGSLTVFRQKILEISGSLSLTTSGFHLVADGYISLPSPIDFVSIQAHFDISVDGSGIKAGISASVSLWSILNGSVEGFLDTSDGSWYLGGRAGFSIGSSNWIGASGSVEIGVGYLASAKQVLGQNRGAGVHLLFKVSGSAWAKIAGIGISVSVSGSLDVNSGVISVEACVDLGLFDACADIHIRFKGGFDVWLSDVAGSLVYLDVNKNGTFDSGEPYTYADGQGHFSFDDPTTSQQSSTSSSQVSIPFDSLDSNKDGQLQLNEGRILLTGGTSKIDGKSNSLVIEIAEGQLFGVTDYIGATVFIDQDYNNTLGASEFSVKTDSSGNFDFMPILFPSKPLDREIVLGKLLVGFDTNKNGSLDTNEGQFVVKGGKNLITGQQNNGTITLDSNSPGQFTPWSNAVIFFDANKNNVQDSNEPSVNSNADGRFSFVLPATERFTATLGLLAAYDTNNNLVLDASEGRLYAVGGTALYTGQQVGAITAIADNLVTGYSPVKNPERIYFDANNNQKYDAATEISVNPDSNGFYTFAVFKSATGSLGKLAPYDTNKNGIIDSSEGVFRIVGGQDINNKLPNTSRLESTPDAYASGFSFTTNPLAHINRDLTDSTIVNKTIDSDTANRLIELGLGLPLYTNVTTFDPKSTQARSVELRPTVLTTASSVSQLVINGAGLLKGAAEGAVADERAQRAVQTALARKIAAITLDKPINSYATVDSNRKIIGGTPMVDLTNSATVESILLDAASILGVNLKNIIPGTTRTVSQYGASVIADHNKYTLRMASAGFSDLDSALATMKSIAQTHTSILFKKLASDEAPFSSVSPQLTIDGIKPLLGKYVLPQSLSFASESSNTDTILILPPSLADSNEPSWWSFEDNNNDSLSWDYLDIDEKYILSK